MKFRWRGGTKGFIARSASRVVKRQLESSTLAGLKHFLAIPRLKGLIELLWFRDCDVTD